MANIEKRITQNGKISFRVKVRLKGFPTQTAHNIALRVVSNVRNLIYKQSAFLTSYFWLS